MTAKEALAISTLGVDHITLSGKILQALADDSNVADFRGEKLDVNVPSSGVKPDGRGGCAQQFLQISVRVDGRAGMHAVDFLAYRGEALDESNNADEIVRRRLDYAIR